MELEKGHGNNMWQMLATNNQTEYDINNVGNGTHRTIATIYDGDGPTVTRRLKQYNNLAHYHDGELKEEEDPESVTYLRKVISEPNVLFYEDQNIALPLQELPIIVKVYNLQVAHQMKHSASGESYCANISPRDDQRQ